MELFLYLLPFGVLLGIITSYTDIFSSKIRNSVLSFSLLFIILTNISFIAFFKFNNLESIKGYYFSYLISTLFIFSISLILWLFGFWNAADSKLITVFALALPPSAVVYNYSNFYSMNFFYNVILVNLIYILFRSFKDLFKFNFEKFKYFEKISFSSLISLFVIVFSFGLISKIFFFISDGLDRFYVNVLFMISLFYFLRKLKIQKYIVGSFFVLSLIFNYPAYLQFSYWKNILTIFIFLTLVRIFINYLSISNVEKVLFDDLKPGMCLAQDFILDGKKNSRYLSQLLHYNELKGLSESNISFIKKRRNDISSGGILISRRDNFAPFIFVGYILTVLLQTNLITYVRMLFNF